MLMKMKKVLSREVDYYIAPPIKQMLDKARYQVINSDWDRVYLVDGQEGSGKSLLGLQLAYYLDPTLTLDRVTFSGDEFSRAVSNAKKHQAIIFDEAFNGLSSSGASSKLNKLIVGKLMECRQKNLFIIIILPTLFLLQKYAAVFRSKSLFHVYVTKKGVRGYYRVYNMKNKKILYLNGQKFYSYKTPILRKSYRFYGKYPIDEEQYRKKKLESLHHEYHEEKVDRRTLLAGHLIKMLKEVYHLPYMTLSERLKEKGYPFDRTSLADIASKVA